MANPTLVKGATTCTFISLQGRLKRAATELEELSRPNADLKAYRTIADKPEDANFVSVADFADAATARLEETKYLGLQGGTATHTDEHGQAVSVVVKKVTVTRIQVGGVGVGGVNNGKTVIEAAWTLESLE